MYSVSIKHQCKAGGCGKRATVELFHDQGGRMGYFCTVCGKRRIKEHERFKEREDTQKAAFALTI